MRFISFILLSSTTILSSIVVYARDEPQFSTEFINGRFNKGDIERALTNGINAKQIYSVKVNGKETGDYYFTHEHQHVLFSQKFYKEVLSNLLSDELGTQLQNDLFFEASSARYEVVENTEDSSLSIWFKDNDLLRQSSDETEPLSDAINSLMVNYNASANYYHARDGGGSDASLPLNSHIRLAMYTCPIDLDLSTPDISKEGLHVDNVSLSHLFPSIQSEISAGQTYTNSRYAEGFSFYGVKLHSVDALRSRHDRFYTPRITGYARTNATVEVYQGSRLLFTKTVAAGQFVIDEVQGLSNQTLRVVVNESDGMQHTFLYENTVVPGLLTPGTYSYEASSGTYRFNNDKRGDAFVSVEYSRGFDWFTTTLNTLMSTNYKNMTVGSAFPLQQLGAVGLSASTSRFEHADKLYQGQSYSLNYAKYLNNGFNLQLAGYRYSTKRYISFSDAMDLKYEGYDRHGMLRNRFTATVMMREPLFNNQLSLNITRSNYWTTTPATTTYSLGYGGFVHQVGYNISAARSLTQNFESDTSISLSLSIPFGMHGKSVYTRYNSNHYSNSLETGLNSYSGQHSYSLSAARDMKTQSTSFNGAYSRVHDNYNAQIATSLSSQMAYVSGSLNGTAVAADGHLLFSSSQASTMALASVAGVDHASINGIATQPNGYALVPLNDNFDGQDITVDADSLNNNISLSQSQAHIRPRRGELTAVKFTGKKIKFISATLFDAQHRRLAFGTELTQKNTDDVIIAGTEGNIFISKALTAQKTGNDIELNENVSHCHYIIPYRELLSAKNKLNDFIEIGDLTCQKD